MNFKQIALVTSLAIASEACTAETPASKDQCYEIKSQVWKTATEATKVMDYCAHHTERKVYCSKNGVTFPNQQYDCSDNNLPGQISKEMITDGNSCRNFQFLTGVASDEEACTLID